MRLARYLPLPETADGADPAARAGSADAPLGHPAVVSGVVVGDAGEEVVHDLRGVTSVNDLLKAGAAGRAEAAAWALANSPGRPLAQVRLLPPVRPASIRDFVTFEEHVEGVRKSIDGVAGVNPAWYAAPTFYFTNPHSLIGAHDDVAIPPGSRAFDFELEVAAVLGTGGSTLDAARARDAIVGYTIFNDWSARDLQGREMQVNLGPAKGKDGATTLGPWLVTSEELEPFRDADGYLALELAALVNGERVGHDLLSNAGWTFEEMVVYASRGALVQPGDVFGSGTCGNGGCLAELWGRNGQQTPPPLADGDVVRLEVEGIGVTENRVVAGPAIEDVPLVPTARPRDRRRSRG